MDVLADGSSQTRVANVVYGMDESRIKPSRPFVVSTAGTRLHALDAIGNAVFNGGPVACFKMQVLYFRAGQAAPIATVKDAVLDDIYEKMETGSAS
jgi:hypothetical protein